MTEDKTRLHCPACETLLSVRLSRIPARITSLTCPNCQAEVPLLSRLLAPPPAVLPPAPPLEAMTAAAVSAAPRRAAPSGLPPPMGRDDESDDRVWLLVHAQLVGMVLLLLGLLFTIASLNRQPPTPTPAPDPAPAPLSVAMPDENPLDRIQDRIRAEQQALRELGETLWTLISRHGFDDRINVLEDADGLTLIMHDATIFAAGNAILNRAFKAPLRDLALALLPLPNAIAIEGHTDDRPIAAAGHYASNWELSAARAAAIVRFLVDELGFDPRRLSAAGVAYFKPRYDLSSPDAVKNRRIEIRVQRRYDAAMARELLPSP